MEGNKRNGISLITLVITIVVIVILVGAIVLSISSNNPINQASEAVLRNDLTSIKEQYDIEYANALGKHKGNAELIEIGDFSSNIIPEKYSNNFDITTGGILIKSDNTLTDKEKAIAEEIFGKIKIVVDGVTIPEGFYYVGGKKDTGIVISDSSEDKYKGASYEAAKTLVGNQYVWVPIASSDEFVRIEWNSGYTLANSCEPYESGYSTEVTEYNEMKEKVISNKGFYIARYEASNNAGKVESKCLKMPWVDIMWNNDIAMDADPAEGTASYEGRHVSEKLGYTSVQSTLIYGVQWDNALKFIENSGTRIVDAINWGNYYDATFEYTNVDKSTATKANSTGTLIPTGATERNMKQNISDMAGNVWEWTMETSSDLKRILRSSSYRNNGSHSYPNYRTGYKINGGGIDMGFRIALYVK